MYVQIPVQSRPSERLHSANTALTRTPKMGSLPSALANLAFPGAAPQGGSFKSRLCALPFWSPQGDKKEPPREGREVGQGGGGESTPRPEGALSALGRGEPALQGKQLLTPALGTQCQRLGPFQYRLASTRRCIKEETTTNTRWGSCRIPTLPTPGAVCPLQPPNGPWKAAAESRSGPQSPAPTRDLHAASSHPE